MKFGPTCQLSVEVLPNAAGVAQGYLVIDPDLTVEFEIKRNSLGSSQTGTFKVKNLSEKTRNLIYKDRYSTALFRSVQFRAGYGTFMPLLFNGWMFQAFSYRQGVDFITEIDCWDGAMAMANGFSTVGVGANVSAAQIIGLLTNDLPNTAGTPIIGKFPQVNTRGACLCGNTWQLIQQYCGGVAIIDNNQVKVLGPNEAITSDEIPVIDADTGLLGSPRRYDALIEFEMLFTPQLTVGQIVLLQSVTNSIFNGTYKVMGFEHRGTISPAVAGDDRITKVSLWLGTQLLELVAGKAVQ